MLQTPLDTATLKPNDKPDEWEKKREKNGEIERKSKKTATVLSALRSLIDSCYYIFTLKFKYSDDFNLFEIILADSVDYPAYGLRTVHRVAIVSLHQSEQKMQTSTICANQLKYASLVV